MDKVDIKLLAAMEKNARVSLKNLARDLDVKTSTIYHRLHKLRESNILERFTIVVNPEAIGLTVHTLIAIRLKKMVIGRLDSMFLESFAKFLSDQYKEVLFSSVGNDEQIWVITSFQNDEHFEKFNTQIKENPYIESFNVVKFSKILKGKKIFTFQDDMLPYEEEGEYFDDSDDNLLDNEDEDKEIKEKNTSEVFF
ncbi:MAG: Lrp/AsnC family transcriptional regulator [Promethearchaeota archaeon]